MPPKLNNAQHRALAAIVDSGPVPAVHSVVRSCKGCGTSSGSVSPGFPAILDEMAARSPDLNPVENVWQYMRENRLSNRVVRSYDDIVGHCCDAWNKLVARPWTIMPIVLRDWAYGP